MPTLDAPDWQEIVVLNTSGAVTDAPDWQRVVIGPGGTSPVAVAGDFLPTDFGWAGWSSSYTTTGTDQGGMAPTSGSIYFILVKAVTSTTITEIGISQTGSGTRNYIATENYFGIYTAPGSTAGAGTITRLGVTASGSVEAAFPTAGQNGIIPVALSAGVAVTAGTLYYCAVLLNYSAFSGGWARGNAVTSAATEPYTPTGFCAVYNDGTANKTSLPTTFTLQTQGFNHGGDAPWVFIA